MPSATDAPSSWWSEYLTWLNAEPPAEHPDVLLGRYLNHLVAVGRAPLDIARAIDVIGEQLATNSTGWRDIFDNVYQSPTPLYSVQPNAFLRRVTTVAIAGTALDIAMGQGRNSLFLAANGWRVTGFDISNVGLSIARSRARALGLRVQTANCRTDEFGFGVTAWDLIVATYSPLPIKNSSFVWRVRRALREGGILLVESFASRAGTGQRRVLTEVALEELSIAFDGFDVLHAEETVSVSDWGQDESPLVRFLVRRPLRDCTHADGS